jgi:uncharacterized protein YciI
LRKERRQSGCSFEFAECLKLEAWMLGRMTLAVLSSALIVGGPFASQAVGKADTKPADEKKSDSHDEKRLFAIILKPGPSWKKGKDFSQQGLEKHFRYLKALVDEGIVVAAGGLGDDHGLILLYAKNDEAADYILDNDPAVLQGTCRRGQALWNQSCRF